MRNGRTTLDDLADAGETHVMIEGDDIPHKIVVQRGSTFELNHPTRGKMIRPGDCYARKPTAAERGRWSKRVRNG